MTAIVDKMDNEFILQQDICRIHNAQSNLELFENCVIDILSRPSRISDINIMENAWSMLSNLVYDDRNPGVREN